MSADTMTFVDHPALTTTVTVGTPAICDGGGTTIAVVANGGPPQTPILFNWSDGLFPVSTQAVSPLVSTTYVVVTADGCSDPVVDSIPILVHPPYEPEYTFSAQQCWGEQGFALGTVAAAGDFRFTWGTTTPIVADSISLPAGSLVEVTVVNEDTGCEQDTLLRIPAWPPITSLFSSNPEVDCVPWNSGR
jgi:hypothetical protein